MATRNNGWSSLELHGGGEESRQEGWACSREMKGFRAGRGIVWAKFPLKNTMTASPSSRPISRIVMHDRLLSIQGGHPRHHFFSLSCVLCTAPDRRVLPPSYSSRCPRARAFMVPIHLRLDGHEMSWTFQVEGVAVGFMSVCSQVNLELLHKCFDLGPFHGLCVPHQDDILEPPQEFSIHESSGTVAVIGARGGGALWLCYAFDSVLELGDGSCWAVLSPAPFQECFLVHRNLVPISVSTEGQGAWPWVDTTALPPKVC